MKFNSFEYFCKISGISLMTDLDPNYEKTLKILLDCRKRQGIVFTMGCGGSASTATHFAADLAKTCGGFKAISLVDNIPLVSAYTNDLGWDSVFEGQLENWITPDDVLVGFSVHGGNKKWSGNLTKALKLAKKRGAKIIGFSGFSGGALKEMADACFVVSEDREEYGTPIVEAMHSVIAHGLVFELKERLK
jgi:phosphoheptose isomerase